MILTGGPSLRETARRLGFTVFAGGARHQVAVTSPHPDFAGEPLPMVFDLTAGVYWRQEEDGLLFGWSDPDERPGEAREVSWEQLESVRARLAESVPATAGLGLRKVWAATIDYTPDHLPILASPVEGLVIASAAGHGMMWGPAVARAAAELALTGRTEVVDVSELGLDRFDSEGRSRLATDPIALPFPARRGHGAAGVSCGWVGVWLSMHVMHAKRATPPRVAIGGSAWRLMHLMDARAPTRSGASSRAR